MFAGLFAFVGRLMLALIFIVAGAMKLGDLAGTGAQMAAVGFPASLALPAALFELIAGICIVLGIFTRLFSFLLAGFCLVTALVFHGNTADPMQAAMAMKNIAIAGGFLCLFAYGSAAWSLDAMRERRKAEAARTPSDHDAVGAG